MFGSRASEQSADSGQLRIDRTNEQHSLTADRSLLERSEQGNWRWSWFRNSARRDGAAGTAGEDARKGNVAMNGFTPMLTVAAHQAHAENIKKSERARLAQAAREASGTRSLRQRFSAMLVRTGSRPVNELPKAA